MFRTFLGAVTGALLATAAAAQTPPPALTSIADVKATVTIINATPYSLFTETLGGGLQCIRGAIPATSIAANREAKFTVYGQESGSCAHSPSVGQQTFVIGSPGTEQRINAGYQISSRPGGNSFGGQGRIGPFYLNATVKEEVADVKVQFSEIRRVIAVDAVWQISCAGPCKFETTQLSILNRTASPLQVTPTTDTGCAAGGFNPVTAPVNGGATLQVTSCGSVSLGSSIGALASSAIRARPCSSRPRSPMGWCRPRPATIVSIS